MNYYKIKSCRVCRSKNLKLILELGNFVSCGTFYKIGSKQASPVPIKLLQCNNCKLIQTQHNYNKNSLFGDNYGYRSGINESMKKHLAEIVSNLEKKVKLSDKDIVIDIGSNDGTTLSFYKNKKLTKIGIDPTIKKFKKYYHSNIIAVPKFFSENAFKKLKLNGKAKIITSISMFYDLPDPNMFTNNICKVLDKNGLWLLEQSYLPSMIKKNSFDTICHEHLEYYTLKQINYLAVKNHLKIIDVKLNNVNGGSFQVMIAHKNSNFISNDKVISKILNEEKLNGYLGSQPIKKLNNRIIKIKKKIINFLTKAKKKGQIVHGYGASTKGNTLLQYFNISSNLITAIADRNKSKFGCCTPGTNIPIISEKKSRLLNPDYYFVLPWHFRESFIRREKNYLKRGGKFIFPLPVFEIFSKKIK
jgi:hypothetical protein